jgi:putative ABC transport system substrate-binding protein
MLAELAQRGLMEGGNLVFEARVGQPEQLPDLARQLVGTHPDVIYATGLEEARAARTATDTIPIIATSSHLLEFGLIASLARPGGNLSGVTFFTAELEIKHLALLHELLPAARRVVLLRDPPFASGEHIVALEAAAHDLGLGAVVVEARRPEEIADALRRAHAAGAEAVNVLGSSMFFAKADILAASAINAGMPTICLWREMTEAGCLASYGAPLPEIFRLVAVQIDRVLHGTRVADLPVEQPTKFELVINLKTAKALGLMIPPSMLTLADKVIE